ncbi:hypothetical protein Pint_27225 [Pistacia integerrima]|uniref:Uncharacterized protein n=1 Tax=Pistacia integerrima TaxID=434235 RepID=A0ACC0YP90_9ROSI|nr:hypothetical protein Pint_27225 [Pistacia integerrima]
MKLTWIGWTSYCIALSFWKKSAHRTTLAFTFQLRNEIDACVSSFGQASGYLISRCSRYISYNQLIGPLPNLTGLSNLSYVDMSNNSFEGSTIPPRFSSLQSLTTLYISVFTHSLTHRHTNIKQASIAFKPGILDNHCHIQHR